jgi:hypothetical protein
MIRIDKMPQVSMTFLITKQSQKFIVSLNSRISLVMYYAAEGIELVGSALIEVKVFATLKLSLKKAYIIYVLESCAVLVGFLLPTFFAFSSALLFKIHFFH